MWPAPFCRFARGWTVQQPEECFGGDGEAGLAREQLGAGEGGVRGHPLINHSLDKTLERTGVLVSSTLL